MHIHDVDEYACVGDELPFGRTESKVGKPSGV